MAAEDRAEPLANPARAMGDVMRSLLTLLWFGLVVVSCVGILASLVGHDLGATIASFGFVSLVATWLIKLVLMEPIGGDNGGGNSGGD